MRIRTGLESAEFKLEGDALNQALKQLADELLPPAVWNSFFTGVDGVRCEEPAIVLFILAYNVAHGPQSTAPRREKPERNANAFEFKVLTAACSIGIEVTAGGEKLYEIGTVPVPDETVGVVRSWIKDADILYMNNTDAQALGLRAWKKLMELNNELINTQIGTPDFEVIAGSLVRQFDSFRPNAPKTLESYDARIAFFRTVLQGCKDTAIKGNLVASYAGLGGDRPAFKAEFTEARRALNALELFFWARNHGGDLTQCPLKGLRIDDSVRTTARNLLTAYEDEIQMRRLAQYGQ